MARRWKLRSSDLEPELRLSRRFKFFREPSYHDAMMSLRWQFPRVYHVFKFMGKKTTGNRRNSRTGLCRAQPADPLRGSSFFTPDSDGEAL